MYVVRAQEIMKFVRKYRIRQNIRGGKLSRFSRIWLNRECFPTKYFLPSFSQIISGQAVVSGADYDV